MRLTGTGRRAFAALLLLVAVTLTASLVAGCGKPEPTPAPAAPAAAGPTPAQLFARDALVELNAKNDVNDRVWKRDAKASLANGTDLGTLVFQHPNGLGAVVSTQVIGLYDTKNSMWAWAWAIGANVVPASATEFAQKTHALAQQQNTGELSNALLNPRFNCDQNTVWTLVAIANKMNAGEGAFVLPANDGVLILLAFNDIKLMKADQLPSTQPAATQPTTGPSLGALQIDSTTPQSGMMMPPPSLPGAMPTTIPAPSLLQGQAPTAPTRSPTTAR